MEGNKYLAQILEDKKDADLEQIAKKIVDKIYKLAEIKYRDSFLEFSFAKEGIIMKGNVMHMCYPKALHKKLKKLSKVTDGEKVADEPMKQIANKNQDINIDIRISDEDIPDKKTEEPEENENCKPEETEANSSDNEKNSNFTDAEKLVKDIVETFNDIEATIQDKNAERSLEQIAVLKKIVVNLERDGFKTELTSSKLWICWWGADIN